MDVLEESSVVKDTLEASRWPRTSTSEGGGGGLAMEVASVNLSEVETEQQPDNRIGSHHLRPN